MKIFLTGASGFVGSAVLSHLKGFEVYAAGRTEVHSADKFFKKNICGAEIFSDCLGDVDVVIHCAARAHVMNDRSADPILEYRKVNVEGTLNLAKQASQAGVKRFIFISSIKVNGESTNGTSAFKAEDDPSPQDPYGISKLEAELALKSLSRESQMEIVIIRPPLVYGPGVKGNFLTMINMMRRGVPLPLSNINNKRSFVSLENLVDLINVCLSHPAAANQTFLVSDDSDVSTPALLKAVAQSMNAPIRMFYFPVSLLKFILKILGKDNITEKLIGSLQLDISFTKTTLNWKPPLTFEEGVRRCFPDRDKIGESN